ncbi:hypothetical protein ABID21_002643 [Pseudorhizobium tarimense]|uniref:Uncharacterized protein n=1 Tax=Pseudorhizobium tarimense TaxID=1079109 RepID=A0ABV2H7K6_9HYPH|nr:hypothetical protein [Pseudorhizobium tarimense]MCJ8519636.1 hypothetical protein [Pseudorhizobium tarimense]
MTQNGSHLEQEPAEGSRDVVEHELARDDKKAKENGREVKDKKDDAGR